MAYTTSTNVAEVLQITPFSDSTIPTSTTVAKYISRAESKIESQTGHAWETRTVTDEYAEPTGYYRYGTGVRVKLQHRKVKAFVSGTDKLEIWDGSNWVDYVANKTEGRNADYWVNYTDGTIYLLGQYNLYPEGIRVTYRYGESSVSPGIEECATLMAALMVLNSPEFNQATFTDDGASSRRIDNDRIQEWKDTINNILANNTEFEVV